MPNPTRGDIIEAHKALTNLLKLASGTSTASAIFNEQIVRDALPPKPQPTMAEVEWDDSKHYLAEAEHSFLGKVVMINYDPGLERILYICDGKPNGEGLSSLERLTPTGRRYTLTEVQDG